MDKFFTEENIEKFLNALDEEKVGGNVSVVCSRLGISRNTAYLEKAKNKEFSDKWDEIVEEWEGKKGDILEDVLFNQARDGNITAIIFWLKNRRPDRWKDKRELAGEDGKPIQMEMPGLIEAITAARK